uniref:Uncharacterized protein n=1 Tax=Arundo donax TaxID=35708 RepID=A0A0A8Y4L6_ARUDO
MERKEILATSNLRIPR